MLENKNLESIPKYYVLTEIQPEEIIFKKETNEELIRKRIKIDEPINKELLRKKIKSLLFRLQFNLYSKRTFYVIDAIILTLDNPELIGNLSNLYEKVGLKYNIDSNKIGRSIIGAIDIMNNHISKEQLRSFFYIYNNEKVNPKYFFTLVYEYFSNA